MRARVVEDKRGRKFAKDVCLSPCAVEQGMRIIGGKWTGSILWHLKDGPVRFNDLSRLLAGASKKMIAERLRRLESQDLVKRTVQETAPVTVTYELTPLGQTALNFLDELRQWSEALPDSVRQSV